MSKIFKRDPNNHFMSINGMAYFCQPHVYIFFSNLFANLKIYIFCESKQPIHTSLSSS